MADAKPSPFTKPKSPPIVAPVSVCRLGEHCHVNGKGLKTFGTKFPLATVQRLASCCIQLTGENFYDPTKPDLRVASGVLIAPEVALFAAHSVSQSFKAGGLKVLMDFECNAATAPPGMRSQYTSAWPACTELATAAQAVEVKTLEVGSKIDLDYAMVLIKWNSVSSSNQVKLPRIPVMPKHGFVFSKELLMIGHHDDSKNQGEPTQACAFKLVKDKGPNPVNQTDPNTADTYGYGELGFSAVFGFSGGGVFNEQGELIGLVKGDSVGVAGVPRINIVFLNLGLAAGKTMNDPRRGRLLQWINTGNPLKPGDGGSSPPIRFIT